MSQVFVKRPLFNNHYIFVFYNVKTIRLKEDEIQIYLKKELPFPAVVERGLALEVCECGQDGQGQQQRAEAVRGQPGAAERVKPAERVATLPVVGVSANLTGVHRNDG